MSRNPWLLSPQGRAATPFPGSARRYRCFTRLLAGTCVAGVAAWMPLPMELKSALAVTTIVAAVLLAAAAGMLARDWPPVRPRDALPLSLIGSTVITGAAAFDIGATLYHSPTLEYEANPIAVALLRNGLPLPWVVGMGAVGQLAATVVACLLWVNFIMRRRDYLAWLAVAPGQVPLAMRLLGARRRSISDLLLGRGLEPGAQVVALGALAMALAAYRVWLGMEWFGWVPLSRVLVPAVVLLGAYLLLLQWARCRLREV